MPADACECEQIECCCDPVLPARIRPEFEDTYSIRPFKFEIKCLASGNWEDTLRGKLEGQEGSWAVCVLVGGRLVVEADVEEDGRGRGDLTTINIQLLRNPTATAARS